MYISRSCICSYAKSCLTPIFVFVISWNDEESLYYAKVPLGISS